MKTIYIPSSAWLAEGQRCKNLIEKIMLTGSCNPDSLILDLAVVGREMGVDLRQENVSLAEIDFRDWVSESMTDGGVIDIQAIRRAVAMMTADIYIINAIGFESNIIHRALSQLRIGFYALANWPRGLVLIGDDSQVHQISTVLASTFYMRPSCLGKVETNRIVRQIVNEAFVNRIFGRQIGTVLKMVNFISKWISFSQSRKEKKITGWHFEE